MMSESDGMLLRCVCCFAMCCVVFSCVVALCCPCCPLCLLLLFVVVKKKKKKKKKNRNRHRDRDRLCVFSQLCNLQLLLALMIQGRRRCKLRRKGMKGMCHKVAVLAVIIVVLHAQGGAAAQCLSGRYSSGAVCKDCPSGYYSHHPTFNLHCKVCSFGFTSDINSVRCSPCEKGKAGGPVCADCKSGKYTDQTGQLSCKSCPEGFSNTFTAQSFCTECTKGSFYTYDDSSKKTECDLCPSGFFTDQTQQKQCIQCSKGFYAQSRGLTSCKDCPAGFINEAGADRCINNCGPGLFASSNGSCVQCPIGWFAGNISCTKCHKGKYTNTKGQNSCTSCGLGRFAANQGQSQCENCARGFFTPAPAAEGCKSCPKGWFSDDEINTGTSCKVCTRGMFASVTASINCEACPPGTLSAADEGSAADVFTSCTKCRQGRFVDVEKFPGTTCKLLRKKAFVNFVLSSVIILFLGIPSLIRISIRLMTCKVLHDTDVRVADDMDVHCFDAVHTLFSSFLVCIEAGGTEIAFSVF